MIFGEDYENIPNVIDNSASQGLGLAQPAQAPAQQGTNWKDVVLAAIEGGMTGAIGKPSQAVGIIQRRNELAERKEERNKILEAQKDQLRSQKISAFFSFLEKFDVDDDTASKAIDAMIDANPDLQEVFGDLKGKVKITGKDKQGIKTTTTLKDNEMADPLTGRPLPAGTYEIEARHSGGKLSVVGVKPVEKPSAYAKINPGDYTPESLRDFDKSGGTDRSLLKPRDGGSSPSMSQVEARAIIARVTDPKSGEVDDKKLFDTIKDLKTNPQGADSRIFDYFVKKNKGNEDAAVQEYRGYVTGIAAARSAGSEGGRLGVRSTEAYQGTEENIAQRRAEGSTAGRPVEASTQQALAALSSLENSIGELTKNYDKEFLGPVKGTASAFEARRRVGSYVGSPVEKKETVFRQTLSNISDQLLRARSGAQINEQEYARLARLLPKPTDEPQVFNAGVERFKKEMAQLKQERIRFGTTPRGQLGNQGGAQSGAATPTMRFNPATGKVEQIR